MMLGKGNRGRPGVKSSVTALPLILFCLVFLFGLAWGRPLGLVHQEIEQPPAFRKNKLLSDFEIEAAAALAAATATGAVGAAEVPHISPVNTEGKNEDLALASVGHHDGSSHAGERRGFIVVGTVDGQVHAMEPATGEVRWSFSTGEPLVKSYQQLPGILDEKRWLIPTLDGKMLVHTAQGLRRPGVNARQLVEQTPFLAPGGTFYTGSKISRVYGVDALTGEVRQVLSGATEDSLEAHRRLLKQSDNVVWIGRVDHTVRAFDVPTGNELWNLTIGEFLSLEALDLSSHGSGSGGGGEGPTHSHALGAPFNGQQRQPPLLVATPDGSLRANTPASLSAGDVNSLAGGTGKNTCLWDVPFPAHVSSVFGVTLDNDIRGSAHLPMHPLPLSQSPGSGQTRPRAGSAAVGMLENGQLYAVMLGDHGYGGGDDETDGGGGGVSAGGGAGGSGGAGGGGSGSSNSAGGAGAGSHVGRGKKNRSDGKVSGRGGTQPLLPHDNLREGSDAGDGEGGGGHSLGGGHSVSGSLVPSFSKGSHQ
ncbi:unnamed protein product, partial [Discosporangium mesarthrocarpum]